MTIKEIVSELEELAPLSYQESYDNCGLLTGQYSQKVSGVLFTLDCVESVVDEAISKNCNLIIAHHPIIFSGLKKINGNNYIERTIIKAIKNDIAIYAYHTNLDNIIDGVNAKICETLGMTNTTILAEKKHVLKRLITFCPVDHADKVRKAMFEAGAGKIGNYDECSFNTKGVGTFRAGEGADPFVGKIGVQQQEPEEKIETIYPSWMEKRVIAAMRSVHPYEEVAYDIIPLENSFKKVGAGMIGDLKEEISEQEFLNLVKDRLKASGIRYTAFTGNKIKRVAVCGGSGSFLLNNAIAAGAQAFVTADFKYHQFFDADGKLLLVDAGHFETEQFTPNLIFDIINKKFPNFALHLSEIKTNPINYL